MLSKAIQTQMHRPVFPFLKAGNMTSKENAAITKQWQISSSFWCLIFIPGICLSLYSCQCVLFAADLFIKLFLTVHASPTWGIMQFSAEVSFSSEAAVITLWKSRAGTKGILGSVRFLFTLDLNLLLVWADIWTGASAQTVLHHQNSDLLAGLGKNGAAY